MTYIEKLISIAEADVGYLEKKSDSQLDDKTANAGNNNYTKFGRDMFNGIYQAQPWCATGLSSWGKQAGLSESIFYPHAYCPYGVTWYKNKGQWHDRSGYTPKRGDIIYFADSGTLASHVGLVTGSDGTYVYTIECNTNAGNTLVANGGGVAKKTYTLGYTKILGYASPAYPDSASGTNSSASGSTMIFSTGDIVDFTGTTHYASSNAATGSTCKPGNARVSSVVKTAKHPYHLIKTADGGSTVYGWVDASDIAAGIAVGDKVKVKSGAKTYAGDSLAAYVYNTVYTVIEVSGDRAVIGLNGITTAPIKVDDLIKP